MRIRTIPAGYHGRQERGTDTLPSMHESSDRLSSIGGDVLRTVVDAAPTAVAIVGHDRTFRGWNAAAEELTGWPAARVIGQHDPMVPPDQREATAAVLAEWLADPERGRRTVVRRVRPDGTPMQLALDTVAPVDLDDGPGLVVWFSEATDVDALLVQRNRLSRRLVGATRIEEVVPVLTAAVRDVLGASAAVVLRQCPPALHLHGVRGMGMETEVAEQVELDLDDGRAWDDAVAGRIADGMFELDGRAEQASFVPMGPAGEGWVLATCGTRAARASGHVQDLFRAIADEAWAALQRVALVSDLDGKIEILEATNRLAASVGLDLDAALEAVSSQSADALSCERAGVYLADPGTGEVSLAYVHATDASRDQLLADDEGLALAEEVVRTGEEVLYQDVTACEIAEGPWHADAGAVAVMGLPLHVGHRTVGALVVAHTIAHPRGFTSLCQQVGTAVAQQAALAVEHARLFEVERDNVQRLEELDRMKADWMAGVTHDLKAPLTGLLGFVETLRRMTGRVSEEQQREYLNVMSRQADQLVSLVEDLLLSARVDAEAVARRRELIPVDELVAEAIGSLNPAEREAVRVRDDGISTPVLGDRSHLTRVVLNLLTNALRHGGQHVTVTLGHDDGQVLVAVADDGPGVPPDDRERIFDRFVHGDHEGSSGLGLYVARGIVEAHGGSIRVVDRPGEESGACFEVRFPRGRAQREQDLADVPAAETGARGAQTDVPAGEDRRAVSPPIG